MTLAGHVAIAVLMLLIVVLSIALVRAAREYCDLHDCYQDLQRRHEDHLDAWRRNNAWHGSQIEQLRRERDLARRALHLTSTALEQHRANAGACR